MLATRPNPFELRAESILVPPGSSVSELLEQIGAPSSCSVTLDGMPLHPSRWAMTEPAEGQVVGVTIVPAGRGGKAILNIVIGVGLILASIINPAFLGLSVLGRIAGVAAGASALYGGVRSLMAPAPVTPYSGDVPTSRQSPTLSSGTRNTFRPYGPVAERFGRLLVVPEFAAKPFTETVGSDTFMRALYEFGVGPQLLEDHRIGQTPISEFSDGVVEMIVHPGYDDDPELSIFTLSVDEDPVGFEFEPDTISSDTRFTQLATHEISIDLTFPGGLIAYDNRGEPLEVGVEFKFYWERVGGTPGFSNLVSFTDPLNAGVTQIAGNRFKFAATERGFIRRGIRFTVPDGVGQYRIKVERAAEFPPAGAEVTQNEASWAVLRSIRPTTKPELTRTRGNVTLVEMRIKLEGQFAGVVEDYNAISTRILPRWNSVDGWGPDNLLSTNASLTPTRRHADALAHVLRSKVADERIDTASLANWQGALEGEGRNFDAAVDFFSTVRSVAADIAASGRASLGRADGQYSVVYDQPRTLVEAIITDRNSANFKSERLFERELHAVRVNFGPVEAEGWISDQRIAYADGYDAATAEEFAEIDLWGVTDPDRAYREGRYFLATTALQPELHSFEIDIEHLSFARGSLVRVQSETILEAVASARITQVYRIDDGDIVEEGGLATLLFCDAEIPYSSDLEFSALVRSRDGQVHGPYPIFSWDAPDERILFSPGISDAEWVEAIAPGDLLTIGVVDQEAGLYLVRSVSHLEELRARVELVAYNAGIYNADTEEIPAWDPNITDPIPPGFRAPAPPIIDSVITDETVLIEGRDGTLSPRIYVAMRPSNQSSSVPAAFYQVQFKVSSTGQWRTAPSVAVEVGGVFIASVDQGLTYDLRARTLSADGRASAWVSRPNVLVIGTDTPPPDVGEVTIQPPGDILVWSYPTPPRDLAGFLIRHQAGTETKWSTGIPAHEGIVTETVFDLAVLPDGLRTILIKAIDRSGNESVNAASITATLGGGSALNVVDSIDFHALGWLGTKTDCTVDGVSGDLEADTTSVFWGNDTDDFWGAPGDAFWDAVYLRMIYTDDWSPSESGRMFVLLAVTTDTGFQLDYKLSTDSTWLPWPGFLNADSALTYDVRLTVEGGPTQSSVQTFTLQIDLPDISEVLSAVAVPASSSFRLTLQQTYDTIRAVLATIQNPSASGEYVKILDKSASLGPNVAVYDATDSLIARTVDFRIEGF